MFCFQPLLKIIATQARFVWVLVLVGFLGCHSVQVNQVTDILRPSNDRDWKPEQSKVPFVEIDGPTLRLRNIRNCSYLSVDDFVVDHYDRTIDLNQIQSVDFIVVPFLNTPHLAHTMLSFGMDDGTYVGVSVEVRKERGESYSTWGGFVNRYELMYVLAEERDLIRVRAQHYGNQVYAYPTVATAEQAQQLFQDISQRMNQLASKPEFYHTLTNNCTTNLQDHVNQISPARILDSWKVLLPGYSAEYAYEIGLLDNQIPFEDLKRIAHVNDLVALHIDDPDFSTAIRQGRSKIGRYLIREQNREANLQGSGDRYLESLFR